MFWVSLQDVLEESDMKVVRQWKFSASVFSLLQGWDASQLTGAQNQQYMFSSLLLQMVRSSQRETRQEPPPDTNLSEIKLKCCGTDQQKVSK